MDTDGHGFLTGENGGNGELNRTENRALHQRQIWHGLVAGRYR